MAEPIEMAIEVIFAVLVSFLAGEIAIRFITKIAKRAKVPKPVTRNVREVITTVWFVISLAWVLQILGLTSILTSLTVSGIVGLAISLGLQTTLSNIIAGIFLLQDNALHTGDIILIGTVKGEIVKLGLRNTWIRNETGEIVIVSNSSLSAGPLTNYTAKDRLNKKLSSDD